jgi:hypothetical protein
MGVVRDKLNYLSGTKRLLREAINAILADRGDPMLTESTPFEDYPSALYAGSPPPSAGSLTGSVADKLLRLNETKHRLREAINVELSSRGEPLLTDAEAFRIYSSRLFFTPLELFTNNEQGAWYDPSDLTALFQDSAGTTPVTADGDPVGLMLDKSGNGNHASQSVAAARPIYRTDGTLHWLQFDGVDDYLVTPTFNSVSSATCQVTVGAVLSGTANQMLVEYGRDTSSLGHFYITAPEYGQYKFLANGSSAGIANDLVWVSPASVPETAIITGLADLSEPFKKIRRNGVYGTIASGGSGAFSNNELYIGSRVGTGIFYSGEVFGAIIQFGGNLSDQNISGAESYLAKKAGVTI